MPPLVVFLGGLLPSHDSGSRLGPPREASNFTLGLLDTEECWEGTLGTQPSWSPSDATSAHIGFVWFCQLPHVRMGGQGNRSPG